MLMKENKSHEYICQEMSTAPLDKHTTVYCQGKKCAAWRWMDPPSVKKDRKGYCGKTSRPLPEFYEG